MSPCAADVAMSVDISSNLNIMVFCILDMVTPQWSDEQRVQNRDT